MRNNEPLKRPRFKMRNLIFVFLLIYGIYILTVQAIQITELKREKERVETEISLLEERYQNLQDEAEGLYTEDYIEKVAREELGLVKKGEQAYVDSNLTE